ncbi:MAG: hypothetical protein NDI94_04700 [Candidatus Woesearchaeota archaeon]|nr:hypothetical protein [Candidatus Woesearchaeota archaeon]
MKLKQWLKKRLGKTSIRSALLFTIINLLFLIYFSNILIRLLFFTACVIVTYYLGRLPFDLDLVPLASGILMIWYDPAMAIQFAIWTIPAADVFAGQFNQWTFVSMISLVIGLIIASLFKSLDYKILLFAVIISYNLIRMFITSIVMKQGISGIQAAFTHMFTYLILVSILPDF